MLYLSTFVIFPIKGFNEDGSVFASDSADFLHNCCFSQGSVLRSQFCFLLEWRHIVSHQRLRARWHTIELCRKLFSDFKLNFLRNFAFQYWEQIGFFVGLPRICLLLKLNWSAESLAFHSDFKISFVEKKFVTALLSVRTLVGFVASHKVFPHWRNAI